MMERMEFARFVARALGLATFGREVPPHDLLRAVEGWLADDDRRRLLLAVDDLHVLARDAMAWFHGEATEYALRASVPGSPLRRLTVAFAGTVVGEDLDRDVYSAYYDDHSADIRGYEGADLAVVEPQVAGYGTDGPPGQVGWNPSEGKGADDKRRGVVTADAWNSAIELTCGEKRQTNVLLNLAWKFCAASRAVGKTDIVEAKLLYVSEGLHRDETFRTTLRRLNQVDAAWSTLHDVVRGIPVDWRRLDQPTRRVLRAEGAVVVTPDADVVPASPLSADAFRRVFDLRAATTILLDHCLPKLGEHEKRRDRLQRDLEIDSAVGRVLWLDYVEVLEALLNGDMLCEIHQHEGDTIEVVIPGSELPAQLVEGAGALRYCYVDPSTGHQDIRWYCLPDDTEVSAVWR